MENVKTLQKYKGYPLYGDAAVPIEFKKYLETCVASEEEACNHTFHKVLVNYWPEDLKHFISGFSDYFGFALIPVNIIRDEGDNDVLSFFTSNLNLISKIMVLNYVFPYNKFLCTIEIIFNHKTSKELFRKDTTINEIVSRVVSNRFTQHFKLDLSAITNDKGFAENNIFFYKVSLLSHFKILMLRMGRDTISLDLSHNEISFIPDDVLNFFIHGNLTALNLSHNNIKSLYQLEKVTHNIEKLWLEENPVCEKLNPLTYVATVIRFFPKLKELDDVKLNGHPFYLPFKRNYVVPTQKNTEYVVNQFLTMFFAYYDDPFRAQRKHLIRFYDESAKFSVSCCFRHEEKHEFSHYFKYGRNILYMFGKDKNAFEKFDFNCHSLVLSLMSLPETLHDPSTFQVDVLRHDSKSLVVVVDGVFREKTSTGTYKIMQFRRTFVLSCEKMKKCDEYLITNDLLTLKSATPEQIENSFKNPIRNWNTLMLIEPSTHDIGTVVSIFRQLTKLKPFVAEERLRVCSWDISKALILFAKEFKADSIPSFCFEDDETDSVDLTELMDEID